ncbi:MAG TPA: thiamine pyrophosphate-binding protein [Candidatus Obscuribacterales bacterium]
MSDYLASHLLLDQLTAEGTRFIFGSLASAESPVVTATYELRSDIHFLSALHDEIAGAMAIGYSQASARPGVLALLAAPGLTSALPSMYSAMRARIPLIVLVDQQDSQILSDEPPLSGDLTEIARPLCKWSCELRTAAEIPRLVRRAFHEALSPPKGPVMLSLPHNILLKPSAGRPINPPQSSPLGGADTNFLKKAAKALVAAQNPCVILGNEVSQYKARREAVSLIEVLGCPAFSEPMPTGINFPNRHPQFAGVLPIDLNEASKRLEDYDVVLVLGMQTRIPARVHEPSLIPSSASVIQINIEPGLAGRTLPCQMSACADIAETLSRIRAEIQLVANNQWLETAKLRAEATIAQISQEKQDFEESITYPGSSAPISLIWLLRLIDAIRPQKSVVVNDLVNDRCDPVQILSLESSSSYFSMNSGVSGYGVGASLGIQWASPDHVVVCLTSDQSALYYPQSLWSASHYGLHTKFVIVNNQGKSSFNLQLLTTPGTPQRIQLDNPPVAFAELASSMRVPSAQISIMAELEPALQHMFETPGPYLLDVHVAESEKSGALDYQEASAKKK